MEDLALQLKEGDERGFKNLYMQLKPGFWKYGRDFGCSTEEIEEAYNDTFVALYENVLARKVLVSDGKLRAYIFGIGKYMLFARRKLKGRAIEVFGETMLPTGFNDPAEEKEPSERVKRALERLGPRCREILRLYYYKRFSIDAIQHNMGYKNENTVKAHKSRCMKELKEILTESK